MLEAFPEIGSADVGTRRSAGSRIFSHVLSNPTELEYAVIRLIRGLESQKVSTRTGCYSTLASFLGLNKLTAIELREIVGKTLLTNHQTTNKERRLIYIARILASGVIFRMVPLSKLLLDETLVKGVLNDLVELGGKKSTLLELVTPFISHVLNNKEMTASVFEDVVWPCLFPLFVKSEMKAEEGDDDDSEKLVEKGVNPAILHIALTCFDTGLKTDFGCLSDINQVVRILLSHRTANILDTVGLVVKYAKKLDQTEELWNSLVNQMRSSHFETICMCVQKSIEAGITPDVIARNEVVTPLLGVFLNDEAAEQHSQAVKTLQCLLKWSNDEETKMKKKQRKHVIKALFGGSPNLLHEYQRLLPIIKPFLVEVCTEKDLLVLESVVEKQLKAESNLSIRMSIVYVQFLSRIAQSKKASATLKSTISKHLLSVGFGKEKLNFTKPSSDVKENGEANDSESDSDSPSNSKKLNTAAADEKETDQLVSKTTIESFRSILSSAYNPEFLEDIFQFIREDLDSFCKEKNTKKLFKKAEKQRNKTEDVNLKYILGSYAIRLILEQDKVLGEAPAMMNELLELVKSSDDNDTVSKIMEFIFSSVTKDEQPPFDYEAMFSRLLIENKISDNVIQQFAEIIDVEVNDNQNGEGDEDSSSDDEPQDSQEKMEEGSDDEEVDDKEGETQVQSSKRLKENTKNSSKDDDEDDDESDAESTVDMDDATEEDLKSMDKALAKVFATKKKVREEETSEIRSLMRTFNLLELMINRNAKGCNISIPLLLLLPIVHSLQHSIRGKKMNNLATRIVSVLNKLNAIKKVENVDSVEKGTILSMARDLVALSKERKNKIIADLLGDSVVMLTKCYLQGHRTKGEDTGFITMYKGLLDLKDDKRSKNMGIVSNIVSSVLTTVPNWEEGKDVICNEILSIIFGTHARQFRRMQFLILFRAALADKSITSTAITSWKVKAMKDLTTHAFSYLSTNAEDAATKPILKELMNTFIDSINDPALLELIQKFFKKMFFKESSFRLSKKVVQMATSSAQMKKLFEATGFSERLEAHTNAKVHTGSKRRMEKQVNEQLSTTSPSKKRKSKKIQPSN